MKHAIIAILAFLATPAASATSLSGPWMVEGEFGPQFRYTLLCGLSAAAGGGLSGPCTAVQGPLLRSRGRFSGDTMKFDYDTDYNGSGTHLEYYGRVQPDGEVRGTVKTNSSSGVFQATRLTSGTDGLAAWRVSVGFSAEMKYTVICMFRTDGAKLSGPCAIATGPLLAVTGATDDAKVTIAYDTQFQGRPIHVVYTGTLQADGSLKGEISNGAAKGTFTASRR